jgi:hypothetical protein
MPASTLAKLLSAKSVLAVAALLAGGSGIAIAATANTSSHPVPKPVASHSTESDEPSETSESDAPDGDSNESESESAHSPGTPTPSLEGLCNAYQAGATSNPGKALQSAAFQVLVAAAGGEDKLATYCTDLIGPATTHSHGKPSDVPPHATPSHPGRPTR